MRRLVAILLLLAAAPLFAVDTGRADGKAVVNGKTVRFKYAYAYTTGEQGVTVLVTDRTLRRWDDPRKPVPKRVQAIRIIFEADGRTRVRQIVVQSIDGTFVIDDPSIRSEPPHYETFREAVLRQPSLHLVLRRPRPGRGPFDLGLRSRRHEAGDSSGGGHDDACSLVDPTDIGRGLCCSLRRDGGVVTHLPHPL